MPEAFGRFPQPPRGPGQGPASSPVPLLRLDDPKGSWATWVAACVDHGPAECPRLEMTGDPLRAIPVAKGTGHPRRSHLYNYILTTEKHVDRCQIKESGVRARARVCVSEGV